MWKTGLFIAALLFGIMVYTGWDNITGQRSPAPIGARVLMVLVYAGLSLFMGAFGASLIQAMIKGDDGGGGMDGRGPNDQ